MANVGCFCGEVDGMGALKEYIYSFRWLGGLDCMCLCLAEFANGFSIGEIIEYRSDEMIDESGREWIT
jgi:hypothetical protein